MKKQLLSLISVSILLIAICYIAVNFKGETQVKEAAKGETPVTEAADDLNLFSGTFYGANNTEDNPWNTTAGLITLDDGREAVFLTPQTQYEIPIENEKSIRFEYMLYDQVRDASDGAALVVEYLNEKDEEIYQEVLDITKDDVWLTYHDELDNISKVRISCGNGNHGDDTADWVIIREQTAEEGADNNTDITKTENSDSNVPILNGKFSGANKTDDNPWNTTAGIITLDDGGEAVFLTPETQYEIRIENEKSIRFEYMLYDQVRDASDGAALVVEYLNEKDEEVHQEVLDITKDDVWLTYHDELDNISKVRISCGNGDHGDDTADWVIVRPQIKEKDTTVKDEALQNVIDIFSGDFIGAEAVNDNPWNTTAGIITMDNGSNQVFLTPHTKYELQVEDAQQISFQYSLSKLVKASSDGAQLFLQFFDESDNEVFSDTLEINNDESWVNYSHTLKDIHRVLISCGNGKNGDDVADWVVIRNQNDFSSNFGKDGYVRSATYFGNEWVMNFWNSEMESLEEDFERIKKDGFDSIILVIPWKEFQPAADPIQYNEYAFDNLDKVMKTAENYDLDVYTRISYTWDFYDDQQQFTLQRFLNLLKDKKVHDAWLEYCRTLYTSLSKYPNFKDGFLTWEDFWVCLSVCKIEDESDRRIIAKDIGYQTWISTNLGLEEYNSKFGTEYSSVESIPVPMKDEPAMECFYDFFDNCLNSILSECQSVFPNISMEVRLDADIVTQKNGEQVYYSHAKTYKCEKSDFTATMYGIPMGFENKGERVSAEEALQHTEYILGNLLDLNQEKPVYVEQFLFYDNTPKFSYNAQIKSEDIGKYLEQVSDILGQYTRGYGIWTYKDYRDNMLYNAQFALQNNGWNTNENVKFERFGDSKSWVCQLSEGGCISQNISQMRQHFKEDECILEIQVKECENASLKITVENQTQNLEISEPGIYEVRFPVKVGPPMNVKSPVNVQFPVYDTMNFSLSVEKGKAAVDNLKLYSFVQEGYLYDYEQNEQEFMKYIRVLNTKLAAMDEK